MKEQILEILNSQPIQVWAFENCQVKLSPHTRPIIIHSIEKSELTGKWMVNFDATHEALEEVNHKETLATILQRVKYMVYAGEFTN